MTDLNVTGNGSEVNSSVVSAANASNFDVDRYIESILGPQRTFQYPVLIGLSFVYVAIFATGVIGNAGTCLVIAKNQYMQTATNFYLFNLAVADMITLIFAMPLEIYVFWQQYPWMLGEIVCELKTVIQEASAYVSILTIVAFTLERYVAICHPIHTKTKSKFSRAIKVIVIVWIISLVSAMPYGIFIQINYLTDPNGVIIEKSRWCGVPYDHPDKQWEILMVVSTFLFFVVPMTIITFLYVRIALVLHRSGCLRQTDRLSGEYRRKSTSRTQSRQAVIRMLCAVVVAFFVCWAPYHSQRLLFVYVSIYSSWNENIRNINEKLFITAGCLYYFSSTVNPILYSLMSNRFRVAFRETLCSPGRGCCWFIRHPQCGTQHISSYRNSNSQNSSDKDKFNLNKNKNTTTIPLMNVNRLMTNGQPAKSISGPKDWVSRRSKIAAKKRQDVINTKAGFLSKMKLKESRRNLNKQRTGVNCVNIIKCGGMVIPDLSCICLECTLDLRRIEHCPYCSKYSVLNLHQNSALLNLNKGASLSTGDIIDVHPNLLSGVDHFISESVV